MTERKTLTILEYNRINDGKTFAQGEFENSNENGGFLLTVANKGRMIRWIAKKGFENNWCIYYHWADVQCLDVRRHARKIKKKDQIQKLVGCDDQVYSKYRF